MIPYKRVAYQTLGCKLNFAETSELSRTLAKAGYAKIPLNEAPDLVVINTCSVTENANRKCREAVKQARNKNPETQIVVVGCYAQLKPEEIAAIEGVSMVLGAAEKFDLVSFLEQYEKTETTHIHVSPIKSVDTFVPSHSFGDRTRSFLKVQDGCDYHCAFCTIPLARGKSRSASVSETVKEAQKIGESGIREIVLTGVNIGDFGQGKEETFLDLIKALDKVDSIERFRISSIEPNLLSDEIIEFVLRNSSRFVPHFHIPLQSGSDFLLQKMRRKYNTSLYKSRVEHIKALNKHACVGVDVIVGFPGETDEIFQETLEFIENLDVNYLHVFSYSERPNTTARKMGGSIPKSIRSERSKILQGISLLKKRAFYKSQYNRELKVLWEKENIDGMLYGFTENYIRAFTPFDPNRINTIESVITGESIQGEALLVTPSQTLIAHETI